MADKNIILGIDWGGTLLKIGVFKRGQLLLKETFESKDLSLKNKYFFRLKKILPALAKKGKFSLSQIKSAAVGIPGMLDIKRGLIYYLPNIKGWQNYKFKENFEKHLGIPVLIDNDANIAALAELKFGRAKGINTAICLTLGTGIGFGLVISGKVYRGRSSAAEGGHLPIDFNAGKCGCGSYGCAEVFLGAERFLAKVKSEMKNRKTLLKKTAQITPYAVYKAAKQKDAFALEMWEYFGNILGIYLSGLVNIFNPEKIILSGGLSGAYSFFIKSLKRTLSQRAMFPLYKQVKISRAYFLEDAGLYGAYALAKYGYESF